MTRAILWLGREPEYIRHDVVIQGLRENGVEVVVCGDSSKHLAVRFVKGFLQYLKAVQKPHDFVWVGFFGHPLVWLAKRFSSKPILLDVWLSAFETMVFARKEVNEKGWQARFFRWLDRHALYASDIAIFPSKGEKDYFIQKLGVKKKWLEVVLIGVNTRFFAPVRLQEREKIIVEFHGLFLPVSGVETIVRAAELLREEKKLVFWLIGDGPTFPEVKQFVEKKKLKNVVLWGRKPYREIPALLNQADISLGIFGVGEKANRILPTKIYEAMALAKPSITGQSKGVEELLTDGISVVLVPPLDEKALAEKIRLLAKNAEKRREIGKAAHSVFLQCATPQKIGERILQIVSTYEKKH